MLLGEAGLVPILEVGALAAAVGWMSACAAYLRMSPNLRGRAAAAFGLLVTGLMVLVKLCPSFPALYALRMDCARNLDSTWSPYYIGRFLEPTGNRGRGF